MMLVGLLGMARAENLVSDGGGERTPGEVLLLSFVDEEEEEVVVVVVEGGGGAEDGVEVDFAVLSWGVNMS